MQKVKRHTLTRMQHLDILKAQGAGQMREHQKYLRENYPAHVLFHGIFRRQITVKDHPELVEAIMSSPELGREMEQMVIGAMGLRGSLFDLEGKALREDKELLFATFGTEALAKHRESFTKIVEEYLQGQVNELQIDKMQAKIYLVILGAKNITPEVINATAELIQIGREHLRSSVKKLIIPFATGRIHKRQRQLAHLILGWAKLASDSYVMSTNKRSLQMKRLISLSNGMGTFTPQVAGMIHIAAKGSAVTSAGDMIHQAIALFGAPVPGATHTLKQDLLLKDFCWEDDATESPILLPKGTIVNIDTVSMVSKRDIKPQFSFGQFICGGWMLVMMEARIIYDHLKKCRVFDCTFNYQSGAETVQRVYGSAFIDLQTAV